VTGVGITDDVCSEWKLRVEESSAETEEACCRKRTGPLAPATLEECELWEDTRILDAAEALCLKPGDVLLAIEAKERRERREPRSDGGDDGTTERIGPSYQTTSPPKLSGGICGQLKETDDDRQLDTRLVRERWNGVRVGCC
jgi:hypothetical protein